MTELNQKLQDNNGTAFYFFLSINNMIAVVKKIFLLVTFITLLFIQ